MLRKVGHSFVAGCGFLAVAALGIGDQTALASTQTSTIAVSVTVTASCTISVTPLAFGSPGVFATAVNATGTVTITCTNSTPYSVGLDNGQNYLGGTRRMKDAGTTYINYGIYVDGAYSIPWTTTTSAGSCTGGAGTCALGTGNGSGQGITVYGQIPVQSAPAPATYTDSVIATVTY